MNVQDLLQNAAIIGAVAVPVVLLMLLRTNAAVVFFSLCAGALLVRFAGHEANIASTVMANNAQVVNQYAQVALLLLPVILTALILRKSVPAAKAFLNVVPAIAVGLVGVLLAVPLLSGSAHSALTSTEGWRLLEGSQEFVVAASVAASLLVLWLTKPGHGRKRH